MPDGAITLRSYRLAFQMERRIFRVDRFRIPVPYGLPLRGLAYWLALVAVVLVAGSVPLTNALIAVLPWPLRYILLPGAGAYFLCQPRPDGRSAHDVITAHVAYRLAPKRLVGFAPAPGAVTVDWSPIALAPDESGASYPRGIVRGPASVVLGQPARADVSRSTVRVRQLEDRPLFSPRTVELEAGQRMVLA